MPLFTDGPISELDDLSAHDSQLLTVAASEGIDVTRKLALAQDEIRLELSTLFSNRSSLDQSFWAPSQLSLNSVAVTPALKFWHIYRALALVYGDLYSSQLNDRYGAKRDQFRQKAQWAYNKLLESGVGVVPDPIPQAATPAVTAITGNLPDGTYYITMAWLNSGGEEGACAVPAVITLSSNGIQVQPQAVPQNAAQWNVYVGDAPETMVLQNGAPVYFGQIWEQTAFLAGAGKKPGSGQEPSYYKPLPRVMQRG
ncbi:MAG: hypothetical protein C5B51_17240 [Terriglobia bacterium]|nr:MAG: hypothetical protein C5B51_17240 [Terriglobia bacterium]